jgi:hypothetical protein
LEVDVAKQSYNTGPFKTEQIKETERWLLAGFSRWLLARLGRLL